MNSLLCIHGIREKEEEIYRTAERCVMAGKSSVVKRELSESEFFRRPTGEVVRLSGPGSGSKTKPSHSSSSHRELRCPSPDSRLYNNKDGLLHLEMTRITGGIAMNELDPASRAAAAAAIDEQMSDILSQLQSFRRSFIGSVNTSLPVFPPQRVYYKDQREWPRISSESNEFVDLTVCMKLV